VIKSLVEFAHEPVPNKIKMDIKEVIESSIRFLDYIFRENNIEVDFSSENSIPDIKGDPDQLKQVIINIFLNSTHAMDDGGQLRIRLWREIAQTVEENDYICLNISDTGSGISAEDLPDIFNPFFTKKGKSGTGLGLSISKRIIEGHGGKITIDSEVGKGTECKIILPI
jgi:two-component system NtrC family sensor kinase